ncbi:MAG TPA: anhydro-N-acetylmuramic acid kinase [Rhodanobacteraceae bacterium]|nr:anhydro-N-acetylmuramic acid kinase [Rhodanobacteraceae bacterium]
MSDARGLYLGLISGTSVDGIDAVLARFEPDLEILATATLPWPAPLQQQIVALARDRAAIALDELGALDVRIGRQFGASAIALLHQAGVAPQQVRAIGSHGQTVCHRPAAEPPFSLQLGDAASIAEATGIDVVADFRRADVAAGGQGAPLLPLLHQSLFGRDGATRVVLNLGGIANISLLAPGRPLLGFDTGPANCLLDAWAARHLGTVRDEAGAWAASGQVDTALLARLSADPYFALPPPKSSGREYFQLDWLTRFGLDGVSTADVQATLLALTTHSIVEAIHTHAAGTREVLVCGGGVHNPVLMDALTTALAPTAVVSTAHYGVDPDFIEASAFAWLARQWLLDLPGNLPSVTGARGARVLGSLSKAPRARG